MRRSDVLLLLSRWRIEAAAVATVPTLALAMPSHAAILRCLPLLTIGVALRTWARGHLDRARLTSSGPYAYVRHPLYVGSFLMGLALALMTRRPVLPPLFVVVFAAMYYAKATREEIFQRAHRGAAWDDYAATVGAVLPRVRRHASRSSVERFTWRRVLGHREWQTWLGTVSAVAVLWLRSGR